MRAFCFFVYSAVDDFVDGKGGLRPRNGDIDTPEFDTFHGMESVDVQGQAIFDGLPGTGSAAYGWG
jgi:hypothetical protein